METVRRRKVSRVHLDTHVLLWLHEPLPRKLKPALSHLEGREVVISPMAYLELQYLYEIGRSTATAREVFDSLAESVGLTVSRTPWDEVVRTALRMDWTRDPFDRLIAAHAVVDGVPLVTADRPLRAHCPNAVWG